MLVLNTQVSESTIKKKKKDLTFSLYYIHHVDVLNLMVVGNLMN
jgi:hypothetical protein